MPSSFDIPIHHRDDHVETSSSRVGRVHRRQRQGRVLNGPLRRSIRIYLNRNNRSFDRERERDVQRVWFQCQNEHSYAMRVPDGSVQAITVHDPIFSQQQLERQGGEEGGEMGTAGAVADGHATHVSIDATTLYATAIVGARNLEDAISSKPEIGSVQFNSQSDQEVRPECEPELQPEFLFDEDIPPPPTPSTPPSDCGCSEERRRDDEHVCGFSTPTNWLQCPEVIFDEDDDDVNDDPDRREPESDPLLVDTEKKPKGKGKGKGKGEGKGKGKGKSTRSSKGKGKGKRQENDIDDTNNDYDYDYVPLPGPSNGRSGKSLVIPPSYKVVEEGCDNGLDGPVCRITSYTTLGDISFTTTQYFNTAKLSAQLKRLNEAIDQLVERCPSSTFKEYLPHVGETRAEELLRLEYTRLNHWYSILENDLRKVKDELSQQTGSRKVYEKLYEEEKTKVINRDGALKRRNDLIKRRDGTIRRLKKDIKSLKKIVQDNEEMVKDLRDNLTTAETALDEFNEELGKKLVKIAEIEEKLKVTTEKLEVVKDRRTPLRDLEVRCAELRKTLEEKESDIANFRACTICKRPSHKITRAIQPCGHLVGCNDCLHEHFHEFKFDTCPYCRIKSDGRFNVYWA